VTVRSAILAILAQGPCYGYQLRLEYERRTGGSVNVGQVYTTLDRLERDGLASKGQADAAGHVYYSITAAGAAEAMGWIVAPVERAPRDELAVKLALALTLPGADAAGLIAAQRERTTAEVARLRAEQHDDVARALVADALVRSYEAELAWLEHCESVIATVEPYALAAETPKRGRPSRA